MKVELHCHTVYSMDGLISLDSLIRTAELVGLDAIAVTDHDTALRPLDSRVDRGPVPNDCRDVSASVTYHCYSSSTCRQTTAHRSVSTTVNSRAPAPWAIRGVGGMALAS